MNLNETYEVVAKTANENYANLRKLADINLNVWDQLVNRQMEAMKLCFETGNKQIELAKGTKRADELMGKQAELARELGEQLMENNQQVMEILNKTRDEYQGWFEASAEQVKGQFEKAAPAKTRKAA